MLTLKMSTLLSTIQSWLSSPLFPPIINFVTVVILAITAIEGFRSMKASSEANELTILPLLIIKFIGRSIDNKDVILTNIGNGTAYDVKIDKYSLIITDMQMIWELYMKVKGINIIEPGEKKKLNCIGFENGLKSSIKDLLIFHLDPTYEHERKTIGLFITFKNAKGNKYYSKIVTGKDGLSFAIPPKKLDIKGFFIIRYSMLETWSKLKFYKLLWEFKKPYITP